MKRPLKILVVENHQDTLVYLCRYLEQSGHTVRSAGSVEAALGSLGLESVDILISDIGLPDGDGWSLMENVRQIPKPFGIAMSGYGTSADRQKSRLAGFEHHLVKPFDPLELDALLAEASAGS